MEGNYNEEIYSIVIVISVDFLCNAYRLGC